MDISMGNWILRPIVSSRKNSLNQSWERSQHCCKVSAGSKATGFSGESLSNGSHTAHERLSALSHH